MAKSKTNDLNLENQQIKKQSEEGLNGAREGAASIETGIPDTSSIFNNTTFTILNL